MELYNLHRPIVPKPEEEKLYPKGVVAKALKNVAFQDDGLIQYKADVMLRIFDKDVKPLIGGRAKAMIVASSRVAGLRYFNIIKEKLKARGADYKVLYAFSDFVHPETNESISEYALDKPVKIELAKNENQRDRVLTDEELTAYLEACAQPWRDAATMIAEEGMRPGEVFVLRWPHLLIGEDETGLIRVVEGQVEGGPPRPAHDTNRPRAAEGAVRGARLSG